MKLETTNRVTGTPAGRRFLKRLAARKFRRKAKQDPENAPTKPAWVTPPD